jgi:hypothetical protein
MEAYVWVVTDPVEAPGLAVPLLDAQQRRLSGQVEYKEKRYGVVTHEGQHADELPLPWK